MEGWLTLFVALTGLAVLLQAGVLLGIYLLWRKHTDQMAATMAEVRQMVPPMRAVTENLKRVSEDAVEIGGAAREQFHRVEELIGETGRTLQAQLEKVDRMSREVSARVSETVDVVQDSIIRPVKEVGALARGVSRGFEVLLHRRDRNPAQSAHHDDELFI